MAALSNEEQREIVVALLALERHLLSGGKDAVETQRDYDALRQAYRGPSQALLDQFAEVCSGSEEGKWMVAVRTALEGELDPSAWREVLQRELAEQTTREPETTSTA